MSPNKPVHLMWIQACELLERADRVHRQFFWLGRTGQLPAWEPPVDVFERDGELLVRAAIPDINLHDFEIHLEGAMLRLSGKRGVPPEAARSMIRQLEIPYGPMRRDVTLPPGRYRIADHSYANGCLEVHLQRLKESD